MVVLVLKEIVEFILRPFEVRLITHLFHALFLYIFLLFFWLLRCIVKKPEREKKISTFLFITYTVFLFMLLFLCRAQHEYPFISPWGDWIPKRNNKGEWELDCIYNLLAFIPFSFLCSPLKGKVGRAILVCAIISLLIECMQAYFSVGAFQVSDIVYNALSGGIGAEIYSLYRRKRVRCIHG